MMKKLILMLCMLLLLCSCVDAATKIGLDRIILSGITITMAAPLIPGDKIRTNYQY